MQRLLPARLIAALGAEAASRLELPSDIVRESRRRVRVAAAIGTAAYSVVFVFALSGVVEASSLGRSIDLAHDLVALCLCASLLLIASLQIFSDRQVLGAALVVEVMLCALISLSVPWTASLRTGHLPNLTWVVPIIILFPLLVPTPPRTALVISILCALTMPAGLWILASMRQIEPQPSNYWATCLTAAIGVGIASIASRTVYGAGRQIAAARTIGSYELLEKLGEGGMGEVWKARHMLLARPAAVKLILPERLRGPTEERDAALQRFTREAQVTAGLRSGHTIQLFDFGVSADGTLYYAMELLSGMTVEHFIYQFGPVEPRRVVHWLQQACHSLGEAHGQNLIHRDIKPANLFLCRYGRDVDFLKILDFGLTKPVVAHKDQGLTTPGWLVGTPGYMAPEQVFGLDTGPRTDLYSLGCVAYWLLAGARPFDADNAGELLRQHVHAPPPPLSHKAGIPMPERLEALIMRCLSKDAADRPRDADELSNELASCIDAEPWSPVEAHDWWRRNLAEI